MLADEAVRDEASSAIRSLIGEIRLMPQQGQLAVLLHGNLAAMLALSSTNKNPRQAAEAGCK